MTRQEDGLYAITVAGALFLARDLNDFGDLKWRRTRVLRYRGDNKLQTVIDKLDHRGYGSQFEDLIALVASLLPTSEVIEGSRCIDQPFYPANAMRELIANALGHQDLTVDGKPLTIEIFDSRVEVHNPGEPQLPITKWVEESDTRNAALVEMMRLTGICESRGSGIDRALTSLEELARPAPVFRAKSQKTVVILQKQRTFEEMALPERIWALFLHACLRNANGRQLTNPSVWERFGLPNSKSALVSQAISAAVEAKHLVLVPSGGTRRGARYLPFYAAPVPLVPRDLNV